MKTIKYIITGFVMLFWLLLSHVSLAHWNHHSDIKIWAKDHKYLVVKKRIMPINPIGLFCELMTEDAVYFVLYNEEGKYIGQTSPFICHPAWFDTGFTFPGEHYSIDTDSFIVLDDKNIEALTISTKQKRWWSKILAMVN